MSRLRDKRDRHDRFYKRAKKEQYASRAIYKLQSIDQRFELLRSGARVLDLGCWPGSWLQYCAERVGPSGRVVGLDRNALDIALPNHITVHRGDVLETAPELLLGDLPSFNVIISDMAPDTTGIRFTDVARSLALVERALGIADATTADDGHFVAKIFMGHGFDELLNQVKSRYGRVKMVKPPSSRKESPEQYIVAIGRKPPAQQEP